MNTLQYITYTYTYVYSIIYPHIHNIPLQWNNNIIFQTSPIPLEIFREDITKDWTYPHPGPLNQGYSLGAVAGSLGWWVSTVGRRNLPRMNQSVLLICEYSDLYRLSWTCIHVIGCFCSVDQGAHVKANKNCEEVEVELWIFGWIFTMAFFVQQAMLQPLATSPPPYLGVDEVNGGVTSRI